MSGNIVLFEELKEWDIFSIETLGYFLKAELGKEYENANAILLTGTGVKCMYFEPNTPVVKF